MPVHVSWANEEQTALFMTFEGRWSWAEVMAAIVERNAHIDSQSHIVHVIVDLRTSHGMPPNTLTAARGMEKQHRPQNAGMTVVVGSGAFLKAMFDVFVRLSRKASESYAMVNTIEEAFELISADRVTD